MNNEYELLRLMFKVKLLEARIDELSSSIAEIMKVEEKSTKQLTDFINQAQANAEQAAERFVASIGKIKDAIRQDVFNEIMAVINSGQGSGESHEVEEIEKSEVDNE